MLNPHSLTAQLLKRDAEGTDDAKSTAKYPSSASSISLSGKTLRLPSGKLVRVVEDTGRGTYKCMYDLPAVESYVGMTKEELHEARKVEFNKSFLLKFGEEFEWNIKD